MHKLILEDRDKHYLSTIGLLLGLQFSDLSLHLYETCPDEVLDDEKVILISSLPQRQTSYDGKMIFLSDRPDVDFSPQENLQDQKAASLKIYKYSSFSYLTSCIDLLMTKQNKGKSKEKHVITTSCFIGNASPDVFSDYINEEIEKIHAKHLLAVLCEICPRQNLLYPADGMGYIDTLSDLMIGIIYSSVGPEEIGSYLSPGPAGILRFRPFTRTDDIYECTADNLTALFKFSKEWNRLSGSAHHLLFVLTGVPFSFINALALLSDRLFILNTNYDYMAEEFNREIEILLKNLPSSCECKQVKVNRLKEDLTGVKVNE